MIALTKPWIRRFTAGLVIWIGQTSVLFLLAGVLPGLVVRQLTQALAAVLLVGVLNALAWPWLVSLVIRVHPALYPFLSFVLNGLIVELAARLVPGVEVGGLLTAIIVSVALTVTQVLLGGLFSINDEAAFDRFAVRPLRRRHARQPVGPTAADIPGVLFVQIDGLGEPVLRQAIAAGYAPTLQRWLETRSHELTGWECDLSSQTLASQAGILHGNNFNIPAFRWLDKQTGVVMVANHAGDAAHIQRAVSDGHGLLAQHGASVGNLLSGDAPDSFLTMSMLHAAGQVGGTQIFLYYANLYDVARLVALLASDVVEELSYASWQRLRKVRPRVHRGGVYPLVRAASTVALREFTTYTLIGDMLRGVPVAYADYVAYDEVAHHSGVTARDALRVLRRLDRDLGRLERVARWAPRRYHFVVLSDHGQSQGATFKQRHGESLKELVERLLRTPEAVREVAHTSEGWGSLNALLTELSALEHWVAGRLVRRALRDRMVNGRVALGPDTKRLRGSGASSASGVVVLGSGNLGLIYFAESKERLSLEQIDARFPGLIPGLARHEGIGFLMVRSEQDGTLVIGARGVYYLGRDCFAGENPLAKFGPNAPRHLRKEDQYPCVPDILVSSDYDPERDEVAAFEELVGNHGGLGGGQSRAFVVHPAGWDPGNEPIVGPERLHHLLREWLSQLQEGEGAVSADPQYPANVRA
jgi:uncharacterized membrane protein YvlD (DUF360 family)